VKGYPQVLAERETLEAIISGRSIARYGDGELRVALGRKCVSQEADKKLAGELRAILADEQNGLLVGIPNINSKTPKSESWSRFCAPGYTTMYHQPSYASSFITRPDSAPWIDTPEYWNRVHDLWRGKDVVLIAGDRKSLRAEEMTAEAASVREIKARVSTRMRRLIASRKKSTATRPDLDVPRLYRHRARGAAPQEGPLGHRPWAHRHVHAARRYLQYATR
jgi:hypothetical protein